MASDNQEKEISSEIKKELLEAFNLPAKGLKRRENTIMTRVSHEDLFVMEALVELGIFKSISESAAFMIHDSISSKSNYYQKILKIFREIKAKKLEAVATLLESVKEERMQSEDADDSLFQVGGSSTRVARDATKDTKSDGDE